MKNKYMSIALSMAQKAFNKNEVPIGAVIVKNNKIIAKAFNKRNKSQIATHHAEILAINKACKKLKSWRLLDCDIYVTLEPCPMCAGAILNARIANLYFGAYETAKTNICQNILSNPKLLNHSTNVVGGVMQNECSKLLSNFFLKKRN